MARQAPSGPLHYLTIAEAAALLRGRALSPVAFTRAVLERLEATEPLLHAFVCARPEAALAQARQAEAEVGRGEYRGPLHGIPLNLKDLYDAAGWPTQAGSGALQGYVPERDSTVAARLKQAGAVLIGKTVTNEFGLGYNTVATRCPWRLDLDCHPGGSSVGAAVAVAAGSSLGGFGTDTGGSVRVPGAINGVVALKPTYGRVSRHGIYPLSHSLDHAGLLAWTVTDAALLLNAVAGHDPADPASARRPAADYTASLEQGVRGLRLGVEREYFFQGIQAEVRAGFERAAEALQAQGAQAVEVSLKALEFAPDAALTILLAEAAAVHYPRLREGGRGYEAVTRRRLTFGALIPARDYLAATRARGHAARLLRRAFEDNRLDALLLPTLPGATLTRREQALAEAGGAGGEALAGQFRNGVPFNLSGQPALSVPCGFSERGLPLGLQIVGRPFDEARVLQIGRACELAFERKRPELHGGALAEAGTR